MRESDGEPERRQKRRIQEIKQEREGMDPLSIGELLLVGVWGYFGG